MPSRPWYKWFPGDYLLDTYHLSSKADLLYRRLLDAHWVHGSIPVEGEQISRLARFKLEDFWPAWEEIKHNFKNRGGRDPRLVNKRMESLLRLCSEEKRAKSDAAKARWNKELHARALDVQCDPEARSRIREEEKEKELLRSSKKKEKKADPQNSSAAKESGTRLPEGWQPIDRDRDWARRNCPGVDLDWETEKFRDYWLSLPGQRGRKSDWGRTWQNWIRRTYESKVVPMRRSNNLNKNGCAM